VEEAVLQTLTDYGALGLFAGYLAWQQNKLQQALQSLTLRFQKQIDSLQERHEQREDTMRARYDAVIADLNKHRDNMSNDMVSALTRSADKLEDLEGQLRELRLALK
jgi:DNA anti-recombination protein RmuC